MVRDTGEGMRDGETKEKEVKEKGGERKIEMGSRSDKDKIVE